MIVGAGQVFGVWPICVAFVLEHRVFLKVFL